MKVLLSRLLAPLLPLPLLACGAAGDTSLLQQPSGCSRFEFPLSPEVSSPHVACTGACGDGLVPPRSGPHCGSTAACRVYESPLDPCVWLHNLEHGHAVLLYNCPQGCPEVVATLEALRNEGRPGSNGVRRILLAPDPQLPKRVAALLWRRAWLADSADPEALRCFLHLQDSDAPEPGLACSP